jgi:hypothetical protein
MLLHCREKEGGQELEAKYQEKNLKAKGEELMSG